MLKFDYYASSVGYNLDGLKKVNALELKGKSKRLDGKYLEVYVSDSGAEDDWREVRDVTAVRTSDGVKLLFKESVETGFIKVHSTWDERDVYNMPVDKAEVSGELSAIAEVYYVDDGKTNSYSYDAKGNRISCIEAEGEAQGSGIVIEYYAGSDLLKSYDGWYFNYDINGNLIARGNAVESEASGDGAGVSAFTFCGDKGELWQYEYDLSNRMVKVLRSENGVEGLSERAGYKYDYRGLCVYKSAERGVEYREYTADGRLIYVEKDGSKVDYVYNGSTIFAEVRAEGGKEEVYYHHTNHLGTTEVISDSEGVVVWEANYEAFGSVLSENGTKAFAASFTGKLYDEDIGLYYFNARWYDSVSGRFITQDPARDGINWWNYCNGNPVRFLDLLGLSKEDWENNGDGTWTVKSEGAKLWDVWGENWDVLSGIDDEEKAKTIHVGETFGKKIPKENSLSEVNELLIGELRERSLSNPIVPDIPTVGDKINETLQNLEKPITDLANLTNYANLITSYGLGKNISVLENISNNFGKISFVLDIKNYLADPSMENQQNLIVDVVGTKYPIGSMFLKAYYSCIDYCLQNKSTLMDNSLLNPDFIGQ